MIDESQYGKNAPESLPAAAYKLTAKTKEGRGFYTSACVQAVMQ